MSQLLKYVKEANNNYRLVINRGKTNVMVVDRAGVLPRSTVLDRYQKEDEFTYLGSLVQANDR